jgi:hypothetical protein
MLHAACLTSLAVLHHICHQLHICYLLTAVHKADRQAAAAYPTQGAACLACHAASHLPSAAHPRHALKENSSSHLRLYGGCFMLHASPAVLQHIRHQLCF